MHKQASVGGEPSDVTDLASELQFPKVSFQCRSSHLRCLVRRKRLSGPRTCPLPLVAPGRRCSGHLTSPIVNASPAKVTNIYIDGFNLYYGSLKGTPHRWLDLEALAKRLLPPDRHQIKRIRYFTARVSARAGDPHGPVRQETYLRALAAAQPLVTAHFGNFKTRPTRMRLANPPVNGPKTVEVLKCKWSSYVAQSDRALWRNRGSISAFGRLPCRPMSCDNREATRSTTPDNSIKLRQIARSKCARYCDK